MKKFNNLSKLHLPKVQFVVIFGLIACALCAFVLESTFLGISSLLLLVVFVYTAKKEELQDPFTPADNKEDDPVPEPAEKLPYVYLDEPVEQKAYTIHYYSPYLGKECSIPFRPRKERGKPFDNVLGIQVSENLVLLRSILFTANFPDDIRRIAKQYDGRFPNEEEIKQIYSKFKEINQNLYECGEPLLRRWKYLYTSGDEDADKRMNYCLNFATGQKSLSDCDGLVCAVLVAKQPSEAEKPEKDIKKFGDEFDVLCVVDGKKVRLPFSKRNLGEPIGIFPFDGPEYLELDEVENKKHTDKDVDESRLLDERFCCDRVSKVVDRLNHYLKKLRKPLLDGLYLADSPYMKGCGWIIGFDGSSDYYGGNSPAKLRYMGHFYETCQK